MACCGRKKIIYKNNKAGRQDLIKTVQQINFFGAVKSNKIDKSINLYYCTTCQSKTSATVCPICGSLLKTK